MEDMDEETKAYVGFSAFPGIGPMRLKLLVTYFGTARAAWEAPVKELTRIKLPEKLVNAFDRFRKTTDLAQYCQRLKEKGVSVLPITDPRYPPRLKEIVDAPFLLYVKGKKTDQSIDLTRTIAVVGTRKITRYGVDVTQRLVTELVACGFTIVSGLAYGVDAVAHQSAIDAGGKTIAVLGCGVDIIATPSNARLYHDIESGHGAIISEIPLGEHATRGTFPARNRIISGLSLGVVVTEGADDSGALITASYAAEQGREVFAVPGPITSPYSRGPSKLLKNGAKLVESVDDILEELGMSKFMAQGTRRLTFHVPLNKNEAAIASLLTNNGPMHIDALVQETGLTIQDVGATLTVLVIRGVLKDIGEGVYGLIV